ncbi:TetR/AcrR family transcriptional regulator [Microtetraspora malaysiensis]|uniref:TetR/AcrR family transcriptional regulator n=1 Tax=Microtetraspora malaysiensis TaxID=161358 RepID=UPI003D8F5751
MEKARPMRADAQRNRARILAAAEEVFADGGPHASTEEVARRAGVAVGTVFRHFPTKADLLQALMKRLLQQVTDDAADLIAHGDPATALFDFFARLVERTAANRTVVILLAAEGMEVPITGPIGSLGDAVGELLARGQDIGAIRPEIRLDETMALLTSACQGALQGGWDHDLRRRTLDIMFAGLRPSG